MEFFQQVLRAHQREPRRRRRHRRRRRSRRWSRSGSATCRRARRSTPIVAAPGRAARGEADRARRQGAAAAALPRLAHAARLRARRRGARRGGRRARRRQELAALQAARLRPADRAGRDGVPGQPGRSASTFQVDRHRAPRPRPRGDPPLIDEEIAQARRPRRPTARELERFQNQIEASFFDRLERVGGFGGKADQLNAYYFRTGNPDYFEEDLARYRALVAVRRAGRGRALPRPGPRADLGGAGRQEGAGRAGGDADERPHRRPRSPCSRWRRPRRRAAPAPGRPQHARRSPGRCARSSCRPSSGSRSRTACASCCVGHARGAGRRGDPRRARRRRRRPGRPRRHGRA